MITRLVIVGAGGHGRVMVDIINLLNKQNNNKKTEIVGFVDDDIRLEGGMINKIPVLGSVRELRNIEHDEVVIAIGDNALRKKIFIDALNQSNRFATICHPKSIISPNIEIGQGSQIVGGVVVNTGSRIGQNTIINTGCTIDHDNWVGDHIHIAPGVHLGGDVVIDDGTFIGMGAIVAPRCKIGKGCLIGAGSVVLRSILDGEFAYGTPAIPKSRDEKKSKHSNLHEKKNEILLLLEEVVEVESGTLRESDELTDIAGWDSMALLGLIAMVDDRFGITLDLDKIASSKNVGDILNLLDNQIK